MRASAMFVWVFINLMCFGMCGYTYLIWSKYWLDIEKQKYMASPTTEEPLEGFTFGRQHFPVHGKWNNIIMKRLLNQRRLGVDSTSIWRSSLDENVDRTESQSSHGNIHKRSYGKPRFPNAHHPILEFDTERYKCNNLTTADCIEKSAEFNTMLVRELHRVLMSNGNVYKSGLPIHNPYHVQYKGKPFDGELLTDEMRYALQSVPLHIINADQEPFKSLGYMMTPAELNLQKRHYNTCAVVTSAGALLGSRMGEFIDSHDMVLRFNDAPVKLYSDDVGSKTTFRILNSKVVAQPELNFVNDTMYQNVTILIWDPADYFATLDSWYASPDFPFFANYKIMTESGTNTDVHILNPAVLWKLWTHLQDDTNYRLRRSPPSSGFLGLWASMHMCKEVRMFEFVPSVRVSRRCHYYRDHSDVDCTLGAWHPLAQEKLVAEELRENSDVETFQQGYIYVTGFQKNNLEAKEE